MTTSVVLVEDDKVTRERISNVLEKDARLELVCACDTLAAGKEAILKYEPELILVDLGLPDGSGLELIGLINQEKIKTKAMVITVFEDDRNIMQAIKAGACGYILKDDDSIDVLDAIRIILEGGAPISPVIARHILQSFVPTPQIHDEALEIDSLTPREHAVLKQVSEGFTDKEIAQRNNISYHTVTTHVKHIYKKLRVNSRVEATRKALSAELNKSQSS